MDVHPMFAPRPSRGRRLAATIGVVIIALIVIIAGVKLFGGSDSSVVVVPVSDVPKASVPVETPVGPVCGDGVIAQGEECDGSNFAGRSCSDEGYPGGELTCSNCRIYFNSCAARECVSEWKCGDWGVCSESGVQTRECRDANACGSQRGRPLEETSCYPETPVVSGSGVAPASGPSFAKGAETVALVFRTADDAIIRTWVNGVEGASANCKSILKVDDAPSGVPFEQVGARAESLVPAVYCYAREGSKKEFCGRWSSVGPVSKCAYNSKIDAAGNTRNGPFGTEGFGDSFSVEGWRINYLSETVELRFNDKVVYSLPSKRFMWRYYPTVNKHWYAVWEFERDGKIVRQVASDVFAPVTFLETPASGYQYGGWPLLSGTYALVVGEPIAKSY